MQPLVEELIPCPDPWEVARKLAHLPHLLFLDSSGGGRYSHVMADPEQFYDLSFEDFHRSGWDPISGLLDYKPHEPRGDPIPFTGGIAGLWSYGLARQFEKIAASRHDEFHIPDHAVGRYETGYAFDHWQNRGWLFSRSPRKRHAFLEAIHGNDQPPPFSQGESIHLRKLVAKSIESLGVESNFTKTEYLAAVRRVIDYIRAGDVFQVNLSQRLLAPLTEHPLELYGRLRKVSPAPFTCYFDAGSFQVISASPERFLQVTAEREIITKPIKGTRPRGKTPEEDAKLLHDLVTNPKDRAENVMIVDLLRNDIGKVAEYGSVTVPKVCEVESYSYVHHLVSEVRGKLRADKTAFDLLKAAFPGGSVTGAPKVRAMEIIAELEPTARGPYCGSIGFIGFDGVMDTNILIRTFTASNGWLQFPVGGGIVADSDPEQEYDETLTKAQGMLKALT